MKSVRLFLCVVCFSFTGCVTCKQENALLRQKVDRFTVENRALAGKNRSLTEKSRELREKPKSTPLGGGGASVEQRLTEDLKICRRKLEESERKLRKCAEVVVIKGNNTFHRRTCKWVQGRDDLDLYENRDKAIKDGKTHPCRDCNPQLDCW